MDPRVNVSAGDMQSWYREARTIERTDCTLDRAAGELAALDRQLNEVEARASQADVKAAVAATRTALRPIVLGLRGDPRDPGHVNLPGRINWLTIQVGNYSGRPTAAQMEWIAKYAAQSEALLREFDAIKKDNLSQLNARLKTAGMPEIAVPTSR
jgi:hypothetical protein